MSLSLLSVSFFLSLSSPLTLLFSLIYRRNFKTSSSLSKLQSFLFSPFSDLYSSPSTPETSFLFSPIVFSLPEKNKNRSFKIISLIFLGAFSVSRFWVFVFGSEKTINFKPERSGSES